MKIDKPEAYFDAPSKRDISDSDHGFVLPDEKEQGKSGSTHSLIVVPEPGPEAIRAAKAAEMAYPLWVGTRRSPARNPKQKPMHAVSVNQKIQGLIAAERTSEIKSILDNPPKGVDFKRVEPYGSLIHAGVFSKSLEIVMALVESGKIDIAAVDNEGLSAYHVAQGLAYGAYSEASRASYLEIAQYLRGVMTGAFKDAIGARDQAKAIALLKAGADPKARFGEGLTALMYASGSVMPDLVKAILDAIPKSERKAFVNEAQPDTGNTALHAAQGMHDDISSDLLIGVGADPAIRNKEGYTPEDVRNAVKRRSDRGWKSDPEEGFWWNVGNGVAIMVAAGLSPPPADWQSRPTPVRTGRAPPASGDANEQVRDYAERIFNITGQQVRFTNRLHMNTQYVRLGPLIVRGLSGQPPAEQTHYILNRLRDLTTIAMTPTGRMILDRIFTGGEQEVFLMPPQGDEDNYETRATESGRTRVIASGDEGAPQITGAPDWASSANFTSDIMLVHELIHAADIRSGDYHENYNIYPNGEEVDGDEARTVGLGPWWRSEGTENSYRDERLTDEGWPILRRTFYSRPNEVGRNGRWGNGDSLEDLEHPKETSTSGDRVDHG